MAETTLSGAEANRAAAMHGPLSPRGAFVGVAGRRGALIVGGCLLTIILLASIFASSITPYDPITQNLRNTLRPPSFAHPFGTDNFGRDVFSRVLHAAKLDLQIGFLCVLFPWILGSVLGAIAGYVGGIVDTIVMRTVDTFTAFPFLIMAIGVIAVLGPGHHQHVHRADLERLEHLCPHRAGRGAGRAQERIRARGARTRLHRRAHPAAPHPAQRHHADGHLRDDQHRAGDPVDGDLELPWPRRAAADADLGHHDRRGQELHLHGLVDGDAARPRHRRRRHWRSACFGDGVADLLRGEGGR